MTSTWDFDKVRRKFRNQVNMQWILPPVDGEILAIDEAKSPKFIEHRGLKPVNCAGPVDKPPTR